MGELEIHALWGVVGGIAAVFLAAFPHSKKEFKAWPNHYKYWSYYLMQFGMIVLGGCLVAAYFSSGNNLSAILSINVGATTPLILQNIVAKEPDIADT